MHTMGCMWIRCSNWELCRASGPHLNATERVHWLGNVLTTLQMKLLEFQANLKRDYLLHDDRSTKQVHGEPPQGPLRGITEVGMEGGNVHRATFQYTGPGLGHVSMPWIVLGLLLPGPS